MGKYRTLNILFYDFLLQKKLEVALQFYFSDFILFKTVVYF